MYILSPSILAADFSKLGEQIKILSETKTQYLHIDVMDGHFVPNISFGAPIIKSIRPLTKMVFDVHLMISEPSKYIQSFIDAGADIVNFHVEVKEDVQSNIDLIKSNKKIPALTVKPNTNIEEIYPYLEQLGMVLIMSVEPGFGGQKFMPSALKKAEALKEYVSKNGIEIDIQMDGGIDLSNVKDVVNAGVNVIVAGSAVFNVADIKGRVEEFFR